MWTREIKWLGKKFRKIQEYYFNFHKMYQCNTLLHIQADVHLFAQVSVTPFLFWSVGNGVKRLAKNWRKSGKTKTLFKIRVVLFINSFVLFFVLLPVSTGSMCTLSLFIIFWNIYVCMYEYVELKKKKVETNNSLKHSVTFSFYLNIKLKSNNGRDNNR